MWRRQAVFALRMYNASAQLHTCRLLHAGAPRVPAHRRHHGLDGARVSHAGLVLGVVEDQAFQRTTRRLLHASAPRVGAHRYHNRFYVSRGFDSLESPFTLAETSEVHATRSGLPRHCGTRPSGEYLQPACPFNQAAQQEHPERAPPPEGSQLRAALGTLGSRSECWVADDQ